jgi:hypothetical protein
MEFQAFSAFSWERIFAMDPFLNPAILTVHVELSSLVLGKLFAFGNRFIPGCIDTRCTLGASLTYSPLSAIRNYVLTFGGHRENSFIISDQHKLTVKKIQEISQPQNADSSHTQPQGRARPGGGRAMPLVS